VPYLSLILSLTFSVHILEKQTERKKEEEALRADFIEIKITGLTFEE